MNQIEMYSKSMIVNIIEAKLIEFFDDYTFQGQYNNRFVQSLYKYIRQNTYTGEHDDLYRKLVNLKMNNPDFSNVEIREFTDRETYELTSEGTIFTDNMLKEIAEIVKGYYNYTYTMISPNRISFKIRFGWLPANTASWLNLINDDCMIDYYIDGITLRKNTHSILDNNKPDSGYVCYRIPSLREYDTVLFMYDRDSGIGEDEEKPLPVLTFASLLDEVEGTKGATLNRIVSFECDDSLYEIGHYNRNYLSTEEATLILQVPYEYAISSYFFIYDVSNMAKINHNNNKDENDPANYFVSFLDDNFEDAFTRYDLGSRQALINKITKSNNFNTKLVQYVLGNFIWKTTDSKIIAYAQNLVNSLYGNSELIANGIWSDDLSKLVRRYKSNTNDSIFDDDVIDKDTEANMLMEYKSITNLDPNEELFNEW